MPYAAPTRARPSATPRQANTVVVGVGDLNLQRRPGFISTHGLGSCVGVTAFDPTKRVGALLHVMLPDSATDRRRAKKEPYVFADTGVRALHDLLKRLGVNPQRVDYKIAGGAAVLKGSFFNIGQRNVLAVRRAMWQLRMPIAHEEVGGSEARTLYLEVPTGALRMRIPGRPEVIL